MARGMRESKIIYQTMGSAAADLASTGEYTVQPGGRELVMTTITGDDIELEANHAALVIPRSGMAYNYGITVLNAPGLIDTDYKGTIGVILYNTSEEPYEVAVGDRVAQLMIVPYKRVYGAKIASKERGSGAYGSTGR